MLRAKEIRLKTKEELKRLLEESQDKLRNLRFSITLKQSKNVREIRKTKKLIAQIKTILKNL
ncbi:50S ribosomal protein L29 [bacterium (Candidatus Moisslbacteria) CG12_big_fil_rev_8_21_14_0_65_36_11]|nr:50S ribosomal protein L29 [Candidatus Kuenenbacteria bacterium]OIP76366.1 MAG: 50S ribosomal protein L29 [Parcubacteria group bacterium CG2_30_36_38]PIV45995.1 MAG: 50S ribosomal protein L29 [bacterium (Candidatus Moisslbacteria) CG02_land_8_20_14_3_00_36_53]PIW68133.1 MAG: 50S ribosomal protein L29 [bacterium (Candidatus Moisslbacteria) CG12_big_fil_rev_8_21_14_0_65_36_11]PIZ90468.1 MAG: 50S ribosomal protein L29 [bacterium (Candidatus Moisslbacteria) CG_4_10_14_0_2_um_filter_36_61]PJC0089